MSDWDHSDAPLNGIAIVGLAGRFPGADSVDELWRNLAAGVESITVFTDEELRAAGIDRATRENPDYVRARGLINQPELFDAAFFGISHRDAELMDPQHRLFLETCWQALEHAAIDPLAFSGAIGVWGGLSTGMTNNTYLLSNLHGRKDLLEPEDTLPVMLGNENDYLTTRVSYKLHLRGPSVNVQSACSTSLVAVAQACQALLTWQCDAAIAGGVSVSYPQHDGYLFQEGGIGSPDGHCRAFDAQAQGTVFSNGVGVVCLRRLEDALADRQTIYAVIRGVGMNNDGSSKVSFAAPSVDGQAEVIAMAHSAADVTPDTIGYVEAHGTGTPLGDPIEVTALTKAFRAGGATGTQYCGLGSVKTNFGHLDSAAGVTGLIKTALALHHEQMPPTLHFEQPNPKCNLPSSPFFVNAALRSWPRTARPRRAGVSSFGIGGTNAHVVLEEAPLASGDRAPQAASTLLVLSAKTATALDAAAANLARHLETEASADLADAAYTLQVGRQPFAHRRALVCGSRDEAIAALRASLSASSGVSGSTSRGAGSIGGGSTVAGSSSTSGSASAQASAGRAINGVASFGSRSVAFMFSGGGTQYVDMARELLDAAPVFREEIERCLEILRPSRDVRRALFPATPEEASAAAALLEQPSWGLPALFAVEYALAQQWIAWGVKPDALIGHSMGEYTAACLAGVMSLDAAIALVLLRGRLFETLPPGEMLGVPLPEADVRPVLARVAGGALAIAAVNAPSSCVVSGAPEALAAFAARMADDGVECRRLHIAVAAHSPMVDPILGEFERFFRTIALHAPSIPVVSNVTGTWLTAEEACAPEYWARHLRQTVRFYEGLGTLLAEPNRVLIEAGPGQTLCGFARQHPAKGDRHVMQASLRHPKEATPDLAFLQQAVGRLWTMGVAIDWPAYAAGQDWRRVALPTYPFEKSRFLIEAAPAPDGARNDVMSDETLAPPPSVAPAARARADRICDRLTELLHKLSGLAVTDIDPRVSFLEMGFDSLFLTQASLRFKSEFKVKVTFRQLFEEAPTLEALAHYIDSKLPADAFPAPAVAAAVAAPVIAGGAAPVSQVPVPAPAPVSGSAPGAASIGSAPVAAPLVAQPGVPVYAPAFAAAMPAITLQPANAGAVERVIQQQLQLMAEQLRIVAGAPAAAPIVAQPAPVAEMAQPVAQPVASPAAPAMPIAATAAITPAPSTAPSGTAASSASTPSSPQPAQPHGKSAHHGAPADAVPMAFGPFRGIDRSVHGLTAHQQRYLDTLIERYARRTQGSKALTESQRARLADPRAVSGFRKVWKEIIYQLATVRSEGSRMWDVDGNEYIDLTSGFGVNLFGYAPPFVTEAVRTQLEQGIELGTLSPLAKEAADLICDLTGMERATFANTGSEAISGAVRAVRTVTGRDWIAVFDDEYHGIAEEVLVKSVGAGGSYRSAPAAPGIPDHLVDKVLVLHYNDPRSIDIIRERADEIAGVIIEPVQNRHPDFRPIEMIRAVRQVTAECDIPLIFDEMITGFRLHPRGAQGYFGVDVDVACYGKIMSGGLPIAAIAGKAEYLDAFDGGPWRFGDDSYPEGGVTFFGGTYTRNPLSLSAAVAALRHLKAQGPGLHETLNAASDRFADAVNALFRRYDAPMRLEHCGSICNVIFTDDNPLPRLLHYYLRDKGVHIYDRPFFVSTAHSEADFAFILKAWDETLAEMQAAHFLGEPSHTPDGTDGGGGGAHTRAPSASHALAGAALAGVGAAVGAHAAIVPFTEAQMEVWLGASMSDAASRSFIEIVSVDLRGPLQAGALERAVAQVVARHESLRMTVVASDDANGPIGFRIAPHMYVPLARRDLSAVPPDAREAALHDVSLAGGDAEPFDLARGPLLRLTLVTLAADHHVLVMAAHHLVCDGWSFGVILHDLAALYSAEARREPATLDEPLQASAFAEIARDTQQSEEAAEAEAFWRKEFATIPEPLELPCDRPRPLVRSYAGGRLALDVDADVTRAAKALSTQQRTTLFATLLGVFETLVFRLSGQSDFVVGIPVAGQTSLGGQDLVAHCVNFVPLRCRVDGDTPFIEQLTTLRTQTLDINEYQNFTYGSLLAKLAIPRDPRRSPLVSVSFTVEPPIANLAFHALQARTLTAPRSTTKNDLHLNVMETDQGLLLEADFDRDLYDEATVLRWLDSYRAILAAVVRTPSLTLSALPLMSDAERRRLLVDWNDTSADYPDARLAAHLRLHETLHGIVGAQAALTPERIALLAGRETLTYAALDRRANQLAQHLARHGVGPDVLVGLFTDRTSDLIVGMLAILKAGGAYVPMDPAYPRERLAQTLAGSRAAIVLTQRALAGALPPFEGRVIRLDDPADAGAIARESSDAPHAATGAAQLAYVLFTSGSTGEPKGVAIAHHAAVNFVRWANHVFTPAQLAGVLFSTSASFDLSIFEIFVTLSAGGRVIIAPDALHLPSLPARDEVTLINTVPSILSELLHVGGLPESVRTVNLAGEALTDALVDRIAARTQAEAIYNLYGPTETTTYSTFTRVRAGSPVTIGRPIARTQAYVLDAQRDPVPVGVTGELYLAGDGLARGYHGRPDLTDERFLPNPFANDPRARMYRTGDLCRWLASGDLQYVGRADTQVKLRGFRIELGAVEAVLGRHPAVRQCAVVVRDDAPGGRGLVAYVEAAEQDGLVPELRAHVARTLPAYMVPAAIVVLTQLPVTPNGKIDRKALPVPPSVAADAAHAAHADHDAVPVPEPAQETDTERRLAVIWQELLGVPAVRPDDNFFLIGGHSLLALRLVHRVHKELGAALPPGALLQWPTLRGLASAIDAAVRPPTSPVPPARPDATAAPRGAASPVAARNVTSPHVAMPAVAAPVAAVAPVASAAPTAEPAVASPVVAPAATSPGATSSVVTSPEATSPAASSPAVSSSVASSSVAPPTAVTTTAPARSTPSNAGAPTSRDAASVDVPVPTSGTGAPGSVAPGAAASELPAAPPPPPQAPGVVRSFPIAPIGPATSPATAGVNGTTIAPIEPPLTARTNAGAPPAARSGVADAPMPQVLVPLATGGQGAPFFWVHGVGGEVFSYMQLSQHLAAARPVYGFTADWTQMPGAESLTLEAMAAHYVRELRTVQPNGPYHLGGFCAAAILALEMARQLEVAGQPAGVLAAFDCDVDAAAASPTGPRAAVAFVRNLPLWVREDARLSSPKELAGRARSAWRRLLGRLRGATGGGTGAKRDDLRDQLGMWRFPDYQLPMLEAHHQAINNYRPKPFNGRVTLFQPRTAPLFGPWPAGHDREWEELARGGVAVHRVAGSHATMMTEPFAAALAARINTAIEEAERLARRPHLVKPRLSAAEAESAANARRA